MKLRKIEVLSFVLVLATFLLAVLVYPHLPERIASHWGFNNQVNGYMGKFWGVFLLPLIMLGCYLIFIAVPRIDPKKQNIQRFERYYDIFILTFMIFFGYVYSLTIFWNLGYKFILMQFMAPAFALLFYVMGIMIEHAQPNWSIGIRTPWTLSNEDVWHKTHKLGGKLFRATGFISLFGIIIPDDAIYFVLIPVIASAIYLVFYSYFEYHRNLVN